jgi:hypothetical protein
MEIMSHQCTEKKDDELKNSSRSTLLEPIQEGLQEMSQQLIENACYKLRFWAHNDEGVHGSCPVEMLHCLHLCIFKYVCDCFFDQLGKTSQSAETINGLAIMYGKLFQRQSLTQNKVLQWYHPGETNGKGV